MLVGVSELSRGLAHSPYSAVAVSAVAELYAWALLGSAAFLMRIGLRRPAVMLTLLIAVYQCDPTLHTETCAYLGKLGALAGAIWFASFVAKISVLAWAMRVQLSRSARWLPVFGALGVLLFPLFLRRGDSVGMSSLVALWVFALFALGLWSSPRITTRLGLDLWAQTVLNRTIRATWSIFAALTLCHVWFWASEFELKHALIIPLLLLLSTRWMPRASSVWFAVAAALLSGILMPAFFATIAGMAAITLALRALRRPSESEVDEPDERDMSDGLHGRSVSFGLAARPERMPLLVGSVSSLYLFVWTLNWSGGAWPAHVWWLDLLLAGVLLGMVWGLQAYAALVPLAMSSLHLGVQTGTVALPRTRAQWGLSEVGLGFALLASALLTSWQLRSVRNAEPSNLAPHSDDSAPKL